VEGSKTIIPLILKKREGTFSYSPVDAVNRAAEKLRQRFYSDRTLLGFDRSNDTEWMFRVAVHNQFLMCRGGMKRGVRSTQTFRARAGLLCRHTLQRDSARAYESRHAGAFNFLICSDSYAHPNCFQDGLRDTRTMPSRNTSAARFLDLLEFLAG